MIKNSFTKHFNPLFVYIYPRKSCLQNRYFGVMDNYIQRTVEKEVLKLISYFPAVGITGPRQVGKTSLVQAISKKLPKESIYLDLENPDDQIKLDNPSLFLDPLSDQTIVLDEIQRIPDLFPALRGIIDRNRKPGRFILLGSASPDLIRDSSESLAGRIAYQELRPLSYDEIRGKFDFRHHWLRGGFPESLLAPDDDLSYIWRQNFVRTYLERDIPLLGLSANPILIGRLWRMVSHLSGELLNMENISKSLGIHGTTVRKYLDFMESAYLIRRIQPFSLNLKKRLVKSPKIYLTDTGILHQLLGIKSFFDLSGHPSVGNSWETYIVNQIISLMPDWAELFFYRTHDGTEADLVITKSEVPMTLVEIKFSTTPKVSRGFHIASKDLGTQNHFAICPVEKSFPLSEELTVVGYRDLIKIFG